MYSCAWLTSQCLSISDPVSISERYSIHYNTGCILKKNAGAVFLKKGRRWWTRTITYFHLNGRPTPPIFCIHSPPLFLAIRTPIPPPFLSLFFFWKLPLLLTDIFSLYAVTNLPRMRTAIGVIIHGGKILGQIPFKCIGACPPGKASIATDPTGCLTGSFFSLCGLQPWLVFRCLWLTHVHCSFYCNFPTIAVSAREEIYK